MTEDENLIPLSALQHFLFCERQYAFIHLEQIWDENRFTAEGKVLHERVDITRHESRRLFRQEFGMLVRCQHLGLTGKCDLVELRLDPHGKVVEVVPVEFKRGTKKTTDVDRVQLCGQALCLEEMFGLTIPYGEFYYLQDHRRFQTPIDGELRALTHSIVEKIKIVNSRGITPAASYLPRRCDNCSLFEMCMPRSAGSGALRVDRYVSLQLHKIREECEMDHVNADNFQDKDSPP